MKDLELLTYFLGVGGSQSMKGYFLNQTRNASDLIQLANLTDTKQVDTPRE